MDFRAYTSEHAAGELIARLEALASSDADAISTRKDGILHDKHAIRCERFEAEISIDVPKWRRLKSTVGLFGLRFGTGEIRRGDHPVLLELWRDEEKEFRWYRVAARWSMKRTRIVKYRDAHWFPLTDELLTELLLSDHAKPETPATVLVMK